jgi:hypothetical protein
MISIYFASFEFKMVSISPDLSVHQRIKLKALKATKKDLNDKLTDSSENFYYHKIFYWHKK